MPITDEKAPAGAARKAKVYAARITRKADSQLVVGASELPADEFKALGVYFSEKSPQAQILAPEFHPTLLKSLVYANNTLMQCVETMEVNIDGTGFEVVKIDEDSADDEVEKGLLESFFKEPFPKQAWSAIRRLLRRDLESTGNGYLEVLRYLDGGIAAVRHLDSSHMRLLRLSEPRRLQRTVERGGKATSMSMWTRERRYCQVMGTKIVYYREFGASQHVNMDTGDWGTDVPVDQRGTEILHFTLIPGIDSSYGVPRWINNLPSVLGSRRAEELNLDFFDAGGLPPAIIFVKGGAVAANVSESLNNYMDGNANERKRALVVEIESSGGTLDHSSSVDVSVERFGASATDPMMTAYDERCASAVRQAFRLSALFSGNTEKFNYATAKASYLLTDTQVFKPERDEFDDLVNMTIVRELGAKTYRVVSKPLSVSDTTEKLNALMLARDVVSPESVVDVLNSIYRLGLTAEAVERPGGLGASPTQQQAQAPDEQDQDAYKGEASLGKLASLALARCQLDGVADGSPEMDDAEWRMRYSLLTKAEMADYREEVAKITFAEHYVKGLSLVGLLGCAKDVAWPR
jgi:PBSX family phage portal protein